MIIDERGRYNSIRTKEEIDSLIGEDFNSLTESEQAALLEILNDFRQDGESPLLNIMQESVYVRPKVPIEDFIREEMFLGKFQGTLYDSVKTDLVEIFNGHYDEVIMGGSTGGGKSTTALMVFIRMLYEMSLLRNPSEAYGIMQGDMITFQCIALTRDLAHSLIIAKLQTYLKQMPYFNEVYKPLKMLEGEGTILFPNQIMVAPGASSETHTIGSNTFGGIIEETNFFKQVRNNDGSLTDRVSDIYSSIKRRMENRFKKFGRLPGKLIIVSSKTTSDAFTEKLIRQNIDNPQIFIRERSFYDAAPRERFSEKKFRVAIGTEAKLSRILSETELEPEGMNVIEVPEDFRKTFELDIDRAIRDLAGYSTQSITPFIARRDKIAECIDKRRSHPFGYYTWSHDLPFKVNWGMIANFSHTEHGIVWKPKVNPNAPRHIHLDISKNKDRTGLCIAHVAGMLKCNRTGSTEEFHPVYYIDLVLQIEPQTGGEVVQSEIRKLIYEFSAKGFFIKTFSADQYNSIAIMQTMKSAGYNTELVSMDRTPEPYNNLKLAFYENRVNMYKYDPLWAELIGLQRDNKTGKIDHTNISSKDISDAVAGCLWTLSKANEAMFSNVKTHKNVQQMMDDENWVLGDGSIVMNDNLGHTMEEWRRQSADGRSSSELIAEKKKKYNVPFTMG